MLKICKYCGKQYSGDPGSTACPECAKASISTVVLDRVCRECGATFPGGPRAWYCPKCRAARKRQQSVEFKRRKRAGQVRKIGSKDACIVCGKEYTVAGGKQKYCPDCAPEAVAAIDRAQGIAWNAEHLPPDLRREMRQKSSALIPCVICGKMFRPGSGAPLTCSGACADELRKKRQAEYERTHKAERNAYHKARRKSKEENND